MSSSSPKTAVIVSSVLAVLVLLQLGVAFTIFIRRATLVANAPASVPPAMSTPAPTPAPAKPTPAPKPPALAEKAPGTTPEPAATPDKAPVNERERMIDLAREARTKGDMTGALAGLRQALQSSPDDPLVISEIAMTYEQMGLVDKALAQWNRVMAAGEKAGDLYGIAAEKLKNGLATAQSPVGRDAEGLQPGSTLGFVDVKKSYVEASPGVEQVELKTAIKSRANATIAAGDVNIQVMFYDLLNNEEVEQTTAKVTSEWATPPPNWESEGIEVLKVNYSQTAKNSDLAPKSAEDRKYLGYIIRVYYKNELQDVRAEPVTLLQYFPPPVTLQTEIPQ